MRGHRLSDQIGCDCDHRIHITSRLRIGSAAKRRKSAAHGASRGNESTGRIKLRRSERTLAHTAGNLVVHLIFSTKKRQPLITPEIRSDLFAYLGGIIREMSGTALIINGTTDHVHMLIRIRPVHAAAEIARVVKSNSSRWLREKWKMDFAWQTGYGAFSVSESNVPAVSRYIAVQEEHHKKRTFQEEYVAFLKKNKIEYDERYIWD